jgi:hypothetical protein
MRYSKFNEYSMIGWSARTEHSEIDILRMYTKRLYRTEPYALNTEVLLWKAEVLHSKIAHALFKANTSI